MQNPIYNEGGKAGLIIGLVTIVITTLAYAIDYRIMANFSFGFGIMGMLLVMLFYFYVTWRKGRGGYVSFKEAYMFGLLTMIMSGVINLMYTAVLYGVIDPDLPNKLMDSVIENTVRMMEGFNLADSDIDDAIDQLEDQPGQFSVFSMVKNFPFQILFYMGLSLLMAAIFKKDRPPFEDAEEK
jgi:hypothetical protein